MSDYPFAPTDEWGDCRDKDGNSLFDNQDDSQLDDDDDYDLWPWGDDMNQCPECGDNLDFSDVDEGFCWSCDI